MKSMTGFGRGTAEEKGITVTVELSSVNSKKQLEFRCSTPRELGLLEPELRQEVQKFLTRGSLNLSVSYRISQESENAAAPLNRPFATQCLADLRSFALDHLLPQPTFRELLAIPGVIREDLTPTEAVKPLVFKALKQALEAFDTMRTTEGKNLRDELALRHAKMSELLSHIIAREEPAILAMRDRIRERIAQLGVELPIDDERLAKEVAFYVDKADITEETVRLRSHLEQYKQLLDAQADAGRNFDFLVQEMSREMNTLAAKTADTLISEDAIALKIELSKVKEQIANIE